LGFRNSSTIPSQPALRQTWWAQSGATVKEVMARIGHSNTRAAMIHQHATRDHAIAAAPDALIKAARPKVNE